MLFSFQDFAPMLKAELFDPDHWATVFKNAGAKCKYKQHSIHNCSLFLTPFFLSVTFFSDIVFTTKHHSGWTNFPSAEHWNWNSMDVGPHLDITGNLTAAIKKQGLYMGLYHSLREWFHPLCIQVSIYTTI